MTATDLIVGQEQSAAQAPSVIQRQDGVFARRVRIIYSSSERKELYSIHPGLIGNGQQCFEGDCTTGNCTLVMIAGDGIDVRQVFF